MAEGSVAYPSVLGPGELIRKVLIVTFEPKAGEVGQVVFVSRRLVGGGFACCYHIGRLSGGLFIPETADCLEHTSAEEVDLRAEAVLGGVRASLEGKFVTHDIIDLASLDTLSAQLDFLAARGLRHHVRVEAA